MDQELHRHSEGERPNRLKEIPFLENRGGIFKMDVVEASKVPEQATELHSCRGGRRFDVENLGLRSASSSIWERSACVHALVLFK